ncbi:uncharacterized protein [Panulirus ornatus]|uniref:uncharacterized protein isoform X4 n=1 Tax=Panulirus ornatus TaxID=150431 RepID=UPI003A86EBDC
MGREGAPGPTLHKHTSRESTKLWEARCRQCYYKRSSSRLPALDSSSFEGNSSDSHTCEVLDFRSLCTQLRLMAGEQITQR